MAWEVHTPYASRVFGRILKSDTVRASLVWAAIPASPAGHFASPIRHPHLKAPTPRHLSDLLNLSFALAENLRRVGIRTPGELAATGAEAAWQGLHQGGFVDSAQSLLALEGAIQGVPWRELAPDRRHELMHFFHAVTEWTAGSRDSVVAA